MQNKIIVFLAACCLAAGCMEVPEPYTRGLHTLTVNAVYPEGYSATAGAVITIESVSSNTVYNLGLGSGSKASTQIQNGIYRVTVHDQSGAHVFNGLQDRVLVDNEDVQLNIDLVHSKTGTIVIKELYCGGCPKTPEAGTYQSDKYVILHNNDQIVQYLDGLCLGTLSPYNSNAVNHWTDAEGNLPDFLPVAQAVWMVGGTGTSFPLQPGQDAVICFCGAIDHSAQYPLSVNLNKSDYFVCYNPIEFDNTIYHPAPGDQIQSDHILEMIIKTGKANAYVVSVNSPAVVLFRAEGTDIHNYVAIPENTPQEPGGSDKVTAIPFDWVVDGLEVFNGGSSENHKRMGVSVDAGYVTLSESFKCHTLMRKVNEEATAERGYEVLQDTNNSSEDFYESDTQSLHK